MRAAAVVTGLSLVLATTACTGDDNQATPATTAASTTSAATNGAPGTTAATTTTSTIPPPPMVEAIPIDITEDLGYAGAVALVSSPAEQRHVLVGYQAEEGQPTRPTAWETADGRGWSEAPAPASPDAQTMLRVTDAAFVGAALAVGGTTNAGDGPRAAVWLAADGRTFDAPPELPLGDRIAGVSAMATSDVGLVVAGWIEDDVNAAFVVVRTTDGAWQQSAVPALTDFQASGIAAIGSTIVVTGTDRGIVPVQARVLVSTDGGVTFQVADTSSLVGGVASFLGPVAAVPGGFVAVSCAPTDTGQRTALGRSVDGLVWTRQDITVVGPDDAISDLGLDEARCSSLRADGDVVHIGVLDFGAAWALSVQPDGTAEARRLLRQPNSLPADDPLVAQTPQGLLAVGLDTTGFSPTLFDAVLHLEVLGLGLPQSGPAMSNVDVVSLSGVTSLHVSLYPRVEEQVAEDFSADGFHEWFESPDGRSFQPRGQPTPAPIQVVTATPFGDLGLGFVEGEEDGTGRGTEGFLRGADGVWQSVGLISTGQGGVTIDDVVNVGPGAVVMGTTGLRDSSTNQSSIVPLVRASVDGTSWWEEEVLLPPGAIGGLSSACTLGDHVFAYGWQVLAGVGSTILAVRDPAGGWTVTLPSGIPQPTTLDECATNGTHIVVLGSGADRSTVWSSTDATAFTEGDLTGHEFADTEFASIEAAGSGFVAVGTKRGPDLDADGAIWTSADGLMWTEVLVDGLNGPNAQLPYAVAVAPDASLTIVGTDTGAVVAWNVPAEAWSP